MRRAPDLAETSYVYVKAWTGDWLKKDILEISYEGGIPDGNIRAVRSIRGTGPWYVERAQIDTGWESLLFEVLLEAVGDAGVKPEPNPYPGVWDDSIWPRLFGRANIRHRGDDPMTATYWKRAAGTTTELTRLGKLRVK